MNTPRRVLSILTTTALALAASGASAPAQEPPRAVAVSLTTSPTASPPAGSQYGELGKEPPGAVVAPLPQVATDLEQATAAHLEASGHYRDGVAADIAQEWAAQGERGELEFYSDVGDGNTHLEEGTGNVYRLTEGQAQERLSWLNNAGSVTPMQGTGFGTAVSYDGESLYLVEYFRN
ncbi:hypothetical protein ACWIB8_08575 [Corynebacterium flavescens]